MKNVLTLLFSAMIMISGAQAQIIGIYVDGTPTDVSGTVVDLAGGEETHEDFDIVNESASTYLLRVTRVKLQTVAGASDYLCWGKSISTGLCYPETVVGPNDPWTTPDAYSWAPLDTGLLSVYHVAKGNPGVALYRYYIIDDSGTELDSVDVRFTSTVGVETNEAADFSAYPNPAIEHFCIEMTDATDSDVYSLDLYNIMGSKVLTAMLSEGKNILDVSDLTNGVYFYSLIRNNKVIETKKVVVR
jgi:hypothetical protein